MSNQSSQSMPPTFLPYGYRPNSPFQQPDYGALPQNSGAMLSSNVSNGPYPAGFQGSMNSPPSNYIMNSGSDAAQASQSLSSAHRPFTFRPSPTSNTSENIAPTMPYRGSSSTAPAQQHPTASNMLYMYNRGSAATPQPQLATQPPVGGMSMSQQSNPQTLQHQQQQQYFFPSNSSQLQQSSVAPMANAGVPMPVQNMMSSTNVQSTGRPLMQRHIANQSRMQHPQMPLMQSKMGVPMPPLEYMSEHPPPAAAAAAANAATRFTAAPNPYLTNTQLDGSGSARSQSPSSSAQPPQVVSNGTMLVQHMTHLQLNGALHHPKWSHFPHTSDTLLPKDRNVYRNAHSLFFTGGQNATNNTEKDIHKTLLNRFRQMSLRVESANKKEDVNFLNEGRYVDINAMENIGLLLSSNPPKRQANMLNGDAGSNIVLSAGDSWHSTAGGLCRSACFRGYDMLDERLVHIRLLLDRAGEIYSHCNMKANVAGFRELHLQVTQLKNKALCIIKDVFVCQTLQNNCLALVSDFQPSCVNILMSHMCDETKAKTFQSLVQGDNPNLLSKRTEEMSLMKEKRAWDYLVQLTSLLFSLHKQGLAYGMMEPSKVLIQEGKRLLLGSVGAWEILHFSPQEKPEDRAERSKIQMEQDLRDLGRLMLAVNFGAVAAYQTLSQSNVLNPPTSIPQNCLLWMKQYYSPEYWQLVQALVEGTINDIPSLMTHLAPHAFECIEDIGNQQVHLETYALKEALNGRMFRLLTKLNMCCHRPGQEGAESSEVLVLRLFLSFVFHQQSESGSPFIDLGHVITCLTKLEGNSSDRISLVSPTAHVMLVSYSEVLTMLNKEFQRLKQNFQYGVMEQANIQANQTPPMMQ